MRTRGSAVEEAPVVVCARSEILGLNLARAIEVSHPFGVYELVPDFPGKYETLTCMNIG